MVKGVDVKNHVAMVTFILVHYTKSLDENRRKNRRNLE